MSLESAVRHVELALERNPQCSTGLLALKRVFGIPRGPSGGPEILAILYADDAFFGYWYGHIVRHPRNPGMFVSLIVHSDKLANAQTVPLLFRRFHYWIKDRLEYHPCAVQNEDDAYQERGSVEEAAIGLASMIARFSHDMRSGHEGSAYEDSPVELRILSVYGMEDARDENGVYPALPMPMELKIVSILG